MKEETAEFKYDVITSSEKIVEMMLNGYYLKHFAGDGADYWSIQNDVVNQTPYIVPIEEKYIPTDKIEVAKSIVLTHWPFPGKKPVVTTFKLKG